MFKTSINAGSGQVGGRGINNLVALQAMLESAPDRIAVANELAAQMTVDSVTRNIKSRGNAAKFVEVKWKRYGNLGLQISIGIVPSPQGSGEGGGKRKYDAEIAAKIFLNSEMGKIGRHSFVLKFKEGGYKTSHSSGRWNEGRWFRGPIHVPEIGAYYFSRKAGVEPIPIKKYAFDEMSKNLNARYKSVLRISGRGGG